MALATWLRALDALTGLVDLTRRLRGEPQARTDLVSAPGATLPGTGQLEARLAGVVVAALKEAFDRDRTRLELETAHIEAERRRAEEALRLELRRQAGDRAFAQLRLMAGGALVVWVVSASLSVIVPGAREAPAKLVLAVGWSTLVASLGSALAGSATLSQWMSAAPGDSHLPASLALTLTPWLLVSGLAITALGLLAAL
jgi:hypothetical protein